MIKEILNKVEELENDITEYNFLLAFIDKLKEIKQLLQEEKQEIDTSGYAISKSGHVIQKPNQPEDEYKWVCDVCFRKCKIQGEIITDKIECVNKTKKLKPNWQPINKGVKE